MEGHPPAAVAPKLMVRTLEILWHCVEHDEEAELRGLRSTVEGISSVDYAPYNNRIVTTGGDGCIRLWQLQPQNIYDWLSRGAVEMTTCCTYIATMKSAWMPLTARWSPHGEMIASAHCEGKVCLWWRDHSAVRGDGGGCGGGGGASADPDEEVWKDYRHLGGQTHDVYDLCFSPDSRFLLTGASNGCVTIHEIEGPPMPLVQITDAHTRFCHGVAWDPWNRYVATFGGGPPLCFYTQVPKTRQQPMQLVARRAAAGSFIGESCMLCFRRVGWSPDGSLFAAPFGKATDSDEVDMHHCVYIYTRNVQDRPAARLIARGYNEIRGVLWAPSVFEPFDDQGGGLPGGPVRHDGGDGRQRSHSAETAPLRQSKHSWGPTDYRMALAVWTSDSVIVYTTDSGARHSDFTDLHMRAITDLAWSADSSFLLTASYDGYISVIHFGGSIGVSHRLPLFASSPITQGICGVKLALWKTGRELENKKRQSELTESRPAVIVHAVRKKAKPEKVAAAPVPSGAPAEASAPPAIGVAELAALMSGT